MRLIDKVKIVNGFSPVDIDAEATTGDYVSMKNYNHCTIILTLGVTGAASSITVQQATSVAGTSAKNLTVTEMYANEAVGTNDTLVTTAVTSNTFDTSTDDGLMYVIEVDAAELDLANGFDCLALACSDPGAETFGSCVYVMSEPRYEAGDAMPTAITD